jgi:hypothetical protein
MQPRREYVLGIVMFITGALVAYAKPDSSAAAAAIFMGHAIASGHALPSVLGASSFSAPASPWFSEGWLGSLGVYALWSTFGYVGLVFANTLLVAAALILLEKRCLQRGVGAGETAIALSIAIGCSLGSLRAGGGVLDLTLTAAFLFFVERAPRKSALWAIAVVVLWCNSSIYGCIAPFLGFCSSVGRSFGKNLRNRIGRAAYYLSFLVAISMTPATMHVFSGYVAYLHLNPTTELHVWEPGYMNPVAFYGAFIPTLILTAWCGLRYAGLPDAAAAIGAMMLVLLNGKYLGIFGFVTGPIVASALTKIREEKAFHASRVTRDNRPVLLLFSLFAAISAVGFTKIRGTQLMQGEGERAKVIDRLAADGREHRLLCTDERWCDYALMRDASNLRVFADSRMQAYPLDVRGDMLTFARAAPAWRKDIERWNIDAVMTGRMRLGGFLSSSPDWRCSDVSEDTLFCERRT